MGIGLTALGVAGLVAWACSGEPRRPNVLLVSVDMLRADHVGCYGYARPTTPEIDRLAREGARFAEHVSSSSWTLPAHAALFTALPDALHGATDTHRALGPEAVTLAERFKSAGYETAGFFAGPYLHPSFGFGQGFERYENCTGYAEELDSKPNVEWGMDVDVMRASHADVTNPTVLERFTRWFQGRSSKPFFAFVHLWDAHFDFTPPPPFDTRFDPDYTGSMTGKDFFFDPKVAAGMPQRDLEHLIALYDGEIAWTDMHVGRMRALLEAAGVLDDTIVVVTSDHGTEFFEHGRKGHRQSLYDEVVRVPLVLRYPARVPARAVAHGQSRSIDVAPTLLELAGIPDVADAAARGEDAFLGQSLLPRFEPGANVRPPRALCELDSVGIHLRAVRTQKWKFIDVIGSPEPMYFDLAADPGEQVPMRDLGTELGQRTSQAYLKEVKAVEAWGTLHPPPSVESKVPEDVRRNLRNHGYVGGGEDDPPPASPSDAPR